LETKNSFEELTKLVETCAHGE